MKQRFVYATFMSKCGLASVVLVGENKFSYVTKKGYVLPYRFIKADDCFRNGMAEVTLLDGRRAFIRENYDIVEIDANNKIKVITTLNQFIESQNNAQEFLEQSNTETATCKEENLMPIESQQEDSEEKFKQDPKEEVLEYYSNLF